MDIYNVEKPVKVIVFNHSYFDINVKSRTLIPGKKLVKCFKTHFGEENVEHMENLTAQEITGALKKVADVSDYSAIIVAVSSHGDIDVDCNNANYHETIYARDKTYPRYELWKHLDTEAWKNKPKIFFIQACRGKDATKGIKDSTKKVVEPDSFAQIPVQQSKFYESLYPDVFILNSTQPGAVAFRDKDMTPFFKALITVFDKIKIAKNFEEMATKICYEVAYNFEACDSSDEEFKCSQQMPCIQSTLTKQLYFPCQIPKDVFLKEYDINKKLAIIVSYTYHGTEFYENNKNDIELLRNTLIKLKYVISHYNDFEAETLFEQLSNNSVYKRYDYLLLIYVGYGEKDELLIKDEKKKISEIWQPFLANNCPELFKKPKMFVISACAITEKGEGISGKFDKMVLNNDEEKNVENKHVKKCETEDKCANIPITADMFFFFGTASEKIKPNETDRSFLRYFCDELKNQENRDVFGVTKAVIKKVQNKLNNANDSNIHIPVLMSTLTKLLPI